jgi:hypothetical protein
VLPGASAPGTCCRGADPRAGCSVLGACWFMASCWAPPDLCKQLVPAPPMTASPGVLPTYPVCTCHDFSTAPDGLAATARRLCRGRDAEPAFRPVHRPPARAGGGDQGNRAAACLFGPRYPASRVPPAPPPPPPLPTLPSPLPRSARACPGSRRSGTRCGVAWLPTALSAGWTCTPPWPPPARASSRRPATARTRAGSWWRCWPTSAVPRTRWAGGGAAARPPQSGLAPQPDGRTPVLTAAAPCRPRPPQEWLERALLPVQHRLPIITRGVPWTKVESFARALTRKLQVRACHRLAACLCCSSSHCERRASWRAAWHSTQRTASNPALADRRRWLPPRPLAGWSWAGPTTSVRHPPTPTPDPAPPNNQPATRPTAPSPPPPP